MFIEWGMGITKTLAILCYNTLPFSMGMMEDDEGTPGEMPEGYMPGMMGQDGMPPDGEFDEGMYDGLDEFDDDGMDYGDEIDDDFDDIEGDLPE